MSNFTVTALNQPFSTSLEGVEDLNPSETADIDV